MGGSVSIMRMLCRLSAGLFVATGLAACQFPVPPDVPDDDDPTMRSIGGAVTGLWTGGAITVRLVSGGVTEDVAATAAEPFVFAHKLADGASYLVTIVDDGPDHDCTIGNGSGQVAGDVTDLAVACTNLVPHGLSISTPIAFTFDPRTTRYMLPVSVLQQEVAVTVTGTSLTAVTVAGQPATVGVPSPRVPLGQGQTTVVVELTKGSLSRRYELVFDRGAVPIQEVLLARASNPGSDDFFGSSVAASGDFAAIGARTEDSSNENGLDNNVTDTGAVYVFRRSADSWLQRQILKGSAITPSRELGNAVAMDGDLMVVGAQRDDGGATDAGAAYVFRLDRATGMWSEEQRLKLPTPGEFDLFGTSVAISRGRIAVSCPACDPGGVRNAGVVYVYEKVGPGWSVTGQVATSPAVMDEGIGLEIALDDTTLAARSGTKLRVFRKGATWIEDVVPSDLGAQLAADTQLATLRLAGDTLAVGVPSDGSGTGQPGDTSAPNSGAIVLLQRSGVTWSRSAFIKLPTPRAQAGFGHGFTLGSDVIVSMENLSPRYAMRPLTLVGGTWVAGAAVDPTIPPGLITSAFGSHMAMTGDFSLISQELLPIPGGGSGYYGAVYFFK